MTRVVYKFKCRKCGRAGKTEQWLCAADLVCTPCAESGWVACGVSP